MYFNTIYSHTSKTSGDVLLTLLMKCISNLWGCPLGGWIMWECISVHKVWINFYAKSSNGDYRVKVELVRNLVAHGDAREGKWRGNWRKEWVASTLTPPPNVVYPYPALLKLMRTPRLPAGDWTDAPTDFNGLVRFGERRNLVSARLPSRSARATQSLLH